MTARSTRPAASGRARCSMPRDREAARSYRLDADLSVTEMLRPVSIANGLDWTDDGREMLYIDTTTRRVDRIEYDSATGALGRRRPWVTIPEGAGHPDGMTLDDEGCAWVALWGASCVVRFSPDGMPDVAHRCAGLEHQQLRLWRSGHGPAADHHGPVAGSGHRGPGCRRPLRRATWCPGSSADRLRRLTLGRPGRAADPRAAWRRAASSGG